jgi:hypothetical protein
MRGLRENYLSSRISRYQWADMVISRRDERGAMDSWMKDKETYNKKDREKLEKGSGFVKAWTLACNWLYRVVSW